MADSTIPKMVCFSIRAVPRVRQNQRLKVGVVRMAGKEEDNMPQATIPGEVGLAVRQVSRRTSPNRAPDGQVMNSAAQRLQASPYAALRSIGCEFHEGVLVLRGRVRTYFLKQMAQETVRTLDGVGLIVNVVEVQGTVGPDAPPRVQRAASGLPLPSRAEPSA